jgi:drug/metabolite transporter (DMT)-like permease
MAAMARPAVAKDHVKREVRVFIIVLPGELIAATGHTAIRLPSERRHRRRLAASSANPTTPVQADVAHIADFPEAGRVIIVSRIVSCRSRIIQARPTISLAPGRRLRGRRDRATAPVGPGESFRGWCAAPRLSTFHAMRTRHAGALPALTVAGSAVMWGLWWVPLRALDQAGLVGDWASLVLYALAAAILLPVAVRRRRRLADGGAELLVVGLSLGVALTAWNHAVLTGEVVRVVLLFYLCPVWATGFARLILKEPVSPIRALSIGLGLSGAAVVLGFAGGVPLPRVEGEWMAVLASVLFALGATYARKAKGSASFEKTFASFAAAVPASGLFLLLAPVEALPAAGQIAGALPLAMAATLLWLLPQTWLMIWGAERLDPGRVTVLLLLEIVAAAVSASLFAGEPFGWREFAGCLLILGAGAAEAFDRRPIPLPAAAAPPGEAVAPPRLTD